MAYSVGKFAALVLAITAIIFFITALLIVFTLARRRQRKKHFERIDEARDRYKPLINALLEGRQEYSQVLSALRAITGAQRMHVLERLCLEDVPAQAQMPVLRRLCEDLGLVDLWQHQLAEVHEAAIRESLSSPANAFQRIVPLSFLVRARSAENLRLIAHQPSWQILVKALEDPHSDVQAVAARALAAIGDPESFPALVKRLHLTVFIPSEGLSVRFIKAAVVSFPLRLACELRASLEHAHPRIRFLATDAIREMVEREAAGNREFTLEASSFSTALIEVFLKRLCLDQHADVRARAAPVIGYFEDPRARSVLLKLIDDPEWFVRMHAVRALAKPRYRPEAEQIMRRLTDRNWRVREAAAHTLAELEQYDLLLDHLVCSDDRYSREQIAEELERSGFLSRLLASYARTADEREKRVVEELARIGKTSYIIALLQNGAPPRLRERFLVDFEQHADPQLRAWVERLAQA